MIFNDKGGRELGKQKVIFNEKGGRGVQIPLKIDIIIYEQPLKCRGGYCKDFGGSRSTKVFLNNIYQR